MDIDFDFERTFYGNTVLEWTLALVACVAVAVAFTMVRSAIVRQLRDHGLLQRDWARIVDDSILSRTWVPITVVASIYGALYVLELPLGLQILVDRIIVVALLLQAAIWGSRLAVSAINRYTERRRSIDPGVASGLAIITAGAQAIVWGFALLLFLDNLGIDITALVAGLGVGGIAVALAAQRILGDLFSSLSIVLDKPFEVGDFVIFGNELGTVERIGIKTTRIRSLTGEEIVVSNSDLLEARIRNYRRMAERRIVFMLGVTYNTPADKLERIPAMVREIVEAQPKARFDRCHFKEYGASSLDFETVYYVLDRDYNIYMNLQQAINFAIFRRFGAERIDFAFPTRTVHLYREDRDDGENGESEGAAPVAPTMDRPA